jgi:hypothetical protein
LTPPQPPVPSDDPSPDAVELVDPATGERLPTADMRERFARTSADVERDPEAERAFVESKIEMIRTHPTLSEAEKEAALAELEEKLRGPGEEPREPPDTVGEDPPGHRP